MASSLLTTDRRWAAPPARKSGMTVLGKVPKPINLPSQRLENNGLDPNLELVPKGTLTWGSKAPSATPNAWGSSSILPTKNDGNPSSSNHIVGRPSSGGGSRPSTAGSESIGSPNAWGPNSRPSSASGTFPSPHLPMATNRPRSAETRPGSSQQLSRFADNASDIVKASIRTIDRSGSSSHGHGFTLSTGDFPTLGSDVNSQRGHSSKGRPTSSSGKEVSQAEQAKSLTAGTGEVTTPSSNHPADITKTDQHAHTGGAPVPTASLPNEGLQPHPYSPNFHMPPPQFDSWRASHGHPPEGMWHRGAAPGGPYRPVGPHGSFPVEPFGYYGQFPPNSEIATRQGSGHGGYHPKNGDLYHHMPPNSYIMNQPVIPVRPVYQGPVPYGPPANFNNANVRDPHFVGGPRQPGILNQYPNQNEKFHPVHSQSRPGKHEPVPRDQLESDKIHVVRRGQLGSLHNSDHQGGSHEFERNVQPAPPLLPHPDGNWTDATMRTDIRDTFSERNRVVTKSVPDQRCPISTDNSVFENAHSHPKETGDGILRNKFREDNSITLDQQPVIKKNAALIEKIGSLNSKARNVDTRNVPETSSSKELKKQQKGTDISSAAVVTGFACASDQSVSVSPVVQRLLNVPIEDTIVGPAHSQITEFNKAGKPSGSINDLVHRRGDASRNSHHGPPKDRPSNKFAGHGQEEGLITDSLLVPDIRNNVQHGQQTESASQLQPPIVPDDMPPSLEYESQRAKMKELAAERAKKLKAEEEERIKKQKAKALAKLEELNRRSSVLQKSNDTRVETDDAHDKQKAGFDVTAKLATSTAEPHDLTAPDSLTALPSSNDPKHTVLHVQPQPTAISHASGGGKNPAAHAASSSIRNPQYNMDHVVQKSVSQSHDISVPKPKQGYRKRHISEEKNSGEKPSVSVTTGNGKQNAEVYVDTSTAVVAPLDDPPAHNKKGARHLRSKKKVDDVSVTSKHPPVVLAEQNTVKVSSEPKAHTSGVIISSSIVPTEGTIVTVGSITVGGMSLASLNQERVKSPDETHNTENSRPKHQQARRFGKHQHAVRPVEKPHVNQGVLWAPVNPPLQNEQSDGAIPDAEVANPTQPAGNILNDGENVTRTKRAEMERYVPKPLSKELQQQNPSHDKEAVDKSNATKLDTAAEPKKWEDKRTGKGPGKSNPSWRRRNPVESASVVPNSADQAGSSNESSEVQKSANQCQPVEPGKQEDVAAENCSAPDQTVTLSVGAAKEHSAANRQRRQHVKAQRNEASSYSSESKDREGKNASAYQCAAPAMDSNSSDHRNVPRSDVKGSGVVSHSKTHWKPKSKSHSQSISDGNIAVEGQTDARGGRVEMNSSKGSDSANQDGSGNKPVARSDAINEKVAHNEQGNLIHEDGSQKNETEQEQVNPAPRRQGQHNVRYHRGAGGGAHRGRGGYDAGRPSHGTHVERQRGGSHLEYQPVGSHNKATDFQQNPSVEERTGGAPASGAFRERGHNRGARPAGHFVRRNPGSAPTTNPYQDE